MNFGLRIVFAVTSVLATLLCSTEALAQTAGREPAGWREQVVYVPYEEFERLVRSDAPGVYVPYEEFQALWEKLKRLESVPGTERRADVLSATYNARAIEGRIEVEARLEVQTSGTGWHRIPLGFNGVAFSSVELGSPSSSFVSEEERYVAYYSGEGRFEATLRFIAPIRRKPGSSSFAFEIPSVAVSRATLTVAEELETISLENADALTVVDTEEGAKRVFAFLGNAGSLSGTWSSPVTVEMDDPIYSVEQSAEWTIERRRIALATRSVVELGRGGLSEVTIAIPNNLPLVSVEAEALRSWSTEVSGDQSRVVIQFHRPRTSSFAIGLEFERALEEPLNTAEQQLPRVLGALSEKGGLEIAVGSGLELQERSGEGLRWVGTRNGQPRFTYDEAGRSARVTLRVLEPTIRSETASMVILGDVDDRWIGTVDVTIDDVGVYDIGIDFPAGWRVVQVGGQPRRTRETPDGQRVVIDFEGVQKQRVTVPFELTRLGSAAAGRRPFSPPRVVDAAVDRGVFAVAAPRALEVRTVETTNLEEDGIDVLDPSGLSGRVPREAGVPKVFRYAEVPATAQIELIARPTAVDVIAQHRFDIQDGEIQSMHFFDLSIDFASTTQFQFVAPSSLDDTLRVTASVGIEAAPGAQEQGETTWNVRFRPDAIGRVRVEAVHVLPLQTLQSGVPVTTTLPILRPVGVRSVEQIVAIERSGSLVVEPRTSGFDPLDPAALPDVLRSGRTSGAFRATDPDPTLEVEVTRFDLQEMAALQIPLVQSVVRTTQEPTLHERITMFVQNARSEALELRIPAERQLLSCRVDGRVMTPRRRADGTTLISLPRSRRGSGLFGVVIELEGQRPGDAIGLRGSIEWSTAEVLGDVPIGKHELELFLPPEWILSSVDGSFRSRRGRNPLAAKLSALTSITLPGVVVDPYAAGRIPNASNSGGTGLEYRGLQRWSFESRSSDALLQISVLDERLFTALLILAVIAGFVVLRLSPRFGGSRWIVLPLGIAVAAAVGAGFGAPVDRLMAAFVIGLFADLVVLAAFSIRGGVRSWHVAKKDIPRDPYLENTGKSKSKRLSKLKQKENKKKSGADDHAADDGDSSDATSSGDDSASEESGDRS